MPIWAAMVLIGGAALGAHAVADGGAGGDDGGVVLSGHPASDSPPALVWDRMAHCEATDNWHANTGNGYFGGLQFDRPTWLAYGGGAYATRADFATREQQIDIAERLRADRGFQPWPACSRRLGLR